MSKIRNFQRWRWFLKQGIGFWEFDRYTSDRTTLYLKGTKKDRFPIRMGDLYIRRNWIEKL